MKKLLPLLVIASVLLGACGANNESAIATSVALTVQAQNARATSTPEATSTPRADVTVVPTLTNIFTPLPPTTDPSAPKTYSDCTKASLVSETIPDGTIMKPEATFYKSWQIKNDSNCTWNTNYKIVFWDGNTLGGAYIYNLPQSALPGDVIDIPIQLVTPKEDGTYKGEWKLQTPDGATFGVGQYGESFYVEIVVNATAQDEDYKITSVSYRLVRDPAAGCATNVFYYVYVTITTNGPIDVRVQWLHSDGYTSSKIRLTYDAAGTYELVPEKGKGGWSFHLGDSPGDKWMQLWQVEPTQVEFDKVPFSYLCQ